MQRLHECVCLLRCESNSSAHSLTAHVQLDGDGFISSTEYMTILNLLSDGGVNKLPFMFSRMDSNHDGRINLQVPQWCSSWDLTGHCRCQEFLDGINEAVSRMKVRQLSQCRCVTLVAAVERR